MKKLTLEHAIQLYKNESTRDIALAYYSESKLKSLTKGNTKVIDWEGYILKNENGGTYEDAVMIFCNVDKVIEIASPYNSIEDAKADFVKGQSIKKITVYKDGSYNLQDVKE